MHPPNPQPPGLLQLAEKAQQLASHSKHERMAVVFQTVSVISVAVMGLAASAHLIRELFGHRDRHDRGGERHHPRSHVDRVAGRGGHRHGHER